MIWFLMRRGAFKSIYSDASPKVWSQSPSYEHYKLPRSSWVQNYMDIFPKECWPVPTTQYQGVQNIWLEIFCLWTKVWKDYDLQRGESTWELNTWDWNALCSNGQGLAEGSMCNQVIWMENGVMQSNSHTVYFWMVNFSCSDSFSFAGYLYQILFCQPWPRSCQEQNWVHDNA